MTLPPEQTHPEGNGFYRFDYLLATAFLSGSYILVVLVWPIAVLRVLLGAFVLFFAPGYALGAILFGKKSGLPPVADLAVVVGLSALFTVGVGLILLILRVGLTANVLGPGALSIVVVSVFLFEVREGSAISGRFLEAAKTELSLPGFEPRQRIAAYALLLAIGIVLAAIAYATIFVPTDSPVDALGISGPDGSVATLPAQGRTNATLSIFATVRNGASGQPLGLRVRAILNGSDGTNFTTVPWVIPLSLRGGVESSVPVALAAGEKTTMNISFRFPNAGIYIVSFALIASDQTALRTVSLSLAIRS